MKRVTILVPDTMARISGGSDWSQTSEIEVTAYAIRQSLELNEYHNRYRFEEGAVQVVSIEDVPDDKADSS